MYHTPQNCWYCHQPYLVYTPLLNYNFIPKEQMSQPLYRKGPMENMPAHQQHRFGYKEPIDEQTAYWKSQNASNYAKQFDKWAR